MLLLPVMGLLLAPQFIAPTVTLAALIANPSRSFIFWHYIDWQIIRWLLPGSLIGAVMGAYIFTQMSVQWLQIALGLFLISTLWQFKFGKRERSFTVRLPHFSALGGVVAFVSGLVGGTGPVMNPFLLNYGAEKECLIATKAVNSFFMQIAKLITYVSFGAVSFQVASYGAVLGLGAIAGTFLARHHLLNIDQQRFRHYTLILMPICGVLLILKAILI